MIRIAIVDDHAIVRAGLRQFLSEQVDMTVVAEATSFEAIKRVRMRRERIVGVVIISIPTIAAAMPYGL